ncbi:MAG: alpha-glucan family phosphorylase [Chloroflexi bacterium]|nr:alpha-glucan family phosphorylase [Chloroflexota bacterium]
MPRPLRRFRVVPSVPDALRPLVALAYNLYWEWDPEALDLFRRLDGALWEASSHNPALMLGQASQEHLAQVARDDSYLAQMSRVVDRLRHYLGNREEWPTDINHGAGGELPRIAYFSMEFGLTECLQIYSGGLGILAGDHLKSASDLRLPLVGVGLLYQQGYFRQYLNADGWQQERYPQNDFANMPIQLVTAEDGQPVTVTVEFPGREVSAIVWRAQVGRIPLYLLDTNIHKNSPADRSITDQLYGGDNEKRIQQEFVLGIGGVRLLAALGIAPTIFHMNEGHSAFLGVERIWKAMRTLRLNFEEARVLTSAGNVFTTHTPVSAGSDYFPADLIDHYLGQYYERLGISRWQFLALGRQNPDNEQEEFCTTVLALRLGGSRFGVSRLHGTVARRIWRGCWPELSEEGVPISSVTNGIHTAMWTSRDMAALFERYLGPHWHERPQDQSVWARVMDIPDEELWRTHERRRERLIWFIRQRLREQRLAAGAPTSDVEGAAEVLRPDALTIGFARRFATYKRAGLIFRDPDRLARLLSDPAHPVQIIIAGKAHPRDDGGKDLIRDIVRMTRRPEFARSVVFVEDYEIVVGRYLLQGADVWLNNPRRPLEASGTSGMKALVNGVLNLSILDGWWDEAYQSDYGWAIGHGEEYQDEGEQDRIESAALYHLLEAEVKPLFYQRGEDNLPRHWISKMKAAMRNLCGEFNTNRMVLEYLEKGYTPAARKYYFLRAENCEHARQVAAWKSRIFQHWAEVAVAGVSADLTESLNVGESFSVRARVRLGELKPHEVRVDLVEGSLDQNDNIMLPGVVEMTYEGEEEDGSHIFTATAAARATGQHGYTVRVVPFHAGDPDPHSTGLLLWADGTGG